MKYRNTDMFWLLLVGRLVVSVLTVVVRLVV
jgi:hypothetical protein